MKQTPPACIRCGNPVRPRFRGWFSHQVHFIEPSGTPAVTAANIMVDVSFNVRVQAPRSASLCLKCTGEAIGTGSLAIHSKLVEVNTIVNPPAAVPTIRELPRRTNGPRVARSPSATKRARLPRPLD